MAIEVSYFEGTKKNPIDREKYAEGPFVIVAATGYRIEADYGGYCPSLPDLTIYKLLKKKGFREGKTCREEAEQKCNFLNQCVKEGRIIKLNSAKKPGAYCYIAPECERE